MTPERGLEVRYEAAPLIVCCLLVALDPPPHLVPQARRGFPANIVTGAYKDRAERRRATKTELSAVERTQ